MVSYWLCDFRIPFVWMQATRSERGQKPQEKEIWLLHIRLLQKLLEDPSFVFLEMQPSGEDTLLTRQLHNHNHNRRT